MNPQSKSPSPIVALHFADVHFGVETYGRMDPATGLNTRLLDFQRSLGSCIDQALEAGIEIALFAGDAYKSRDPSQTHQRAFAQTLGKLTSAGVPVVLLAGNHDIPNTKGKANALEIYGAIGPELITVLDQPCVTVVKTKLGRELRIAAIPYMTKSAVLASAHLDNAENLSSAELVARFYEETVIDFAVQCDSEPDLPTVLICHFTVSGAQIGVTQSGYLINEPQVPKSALARDEFDYIALGHIHRYQDLNYSSQPPMVYSGSPDRIDFGEYAENKGAVIVEISPCKASYRFVESSARPFLNIVVDATNPPAGEGDVFDPTETILSAIASHKIEGCVVRLTYKVTQQSLPLVRKGDIRTALRQAFIVVSIQREIVGADDSARVRSALVAESTDPLAALNAYIGTKRSLADHKDDLITRAQGLWEDVVKNEAR